MELQELVQRIERWKQRQSTGESDQAQSSDETPMESPSDDWAAVAQDEQQLEDFEAAEVQAEPAFEDAYSTEEQTDYEQPEEPVEEAPADFQETGAEIVDTLDDHPQPEEYTEEAPADFDDSEDIDVGEDVVLDEESLEELEDESLDEEDAEEEEDPVDMEEK